MNIPVVKSIDDVYPPEQSIGQRERWHSLQDRFLELYGRKADFIAMSPGRLNIIGEHIDYSLYDVLPMAITSDVIVAVSSESANGGQRVRLANVNEQKFASSEFQLNGDGHADIDANLHDWTNYFKAGLNGACQLLRQEDADRGLFKSVGMDVLVHGTVPPGGGLSSSAALVCASALATLRAHGKNEIKKSDLVSLAMVSERTVGVNSGGMDQAASVYAARGSALHVSFVPELRARTVELPQTNPAMTFVIAQSLVTADKHVTGPVQYNLRVVECTLAAAYLAKAIGITEAIGADSSPLGLGLRSVHDAYFAQQATAHDYQAQLRQLVTLAELHLVRREGYTLEQIATMLGLTVDELHDRYTSKVRVQAERFMLRQRALHVFKEALRVAAFVSLLHTGPETGRHEDYLAKLGNLMNRTQESCRELYDCSCPEVDEMVDIARRAGTYGSRLTGAGWGGCTVHLLAQEKVESLTQALKEEYYNKRFPALSRESLDAAIIVSKPVGGSCLLSLG